MAMPPKSVKLDGVAIENVEEFWFDIDTPLTETNYYSDATFAAKVFLRRKAVTKPITKLFELATNEDGRRKFFKCEVQLQDSDHKNTYHFDLKKSFVEKWSVENPEDPGSPALEKVELRVGDLTVTADGQKAPFTKETF